MEKDPYFARNLGIVVFLGVIWGGTFMMIKIGLEGYGPFTIACARTVFGALAINGLRVAMGVKLPKWDRKLWGSLAGIGLLNTAIPFMLIGWAEQYVPSAFPGLSLAIMPLLVLPLAYFFSDETLNLFKITGIIIGFVGALVLLGPNVEMIGGSRLAELACIAAMLCYAISSVWIRNLPDVDSVAVAATTLTTGAIIMVPIMFATEGMPSYGGVTPTLAIIFLGVVPTGLAIYLRNVVIRTSGSVFMTLVSYQSPIWAVLFGVWLMGEDLPGRFYIALALILSGLLVSRWKNVRNFFVKTA